MSAKPKSRYVTVPVRLVEMEAILPIDDGMSYDTEFVVTRARLKRWNKVHNAFFKVNEEMMEIYRTTED